MNVRRGAFSAIALKTCDYVYAIGGFGESGNPIDSVERYDVASDTWHAIAPLNSKRFMHQACIVTVNTENERLFN